MGTRGAVGFKLDQKEVLFYNHWDSYPDGLGQDVVNYVKSVTDWNVIREQVSNFVAVDDGVKPTLEQKDWARKLGTIDLGVSRQSEDDWYCLTRNAQGNLGLQLELGFGTLANKFILESLFCEYAYVINLDTMELEFYEGFNTDRNAEGRYAKGSEPSGNEIADGYAGVVLKGEAPLDNIPDDWIEKFYPSEEDEDE
jgi:hypothetical protein